MHWLYVWFVALFQAKFHYLVEQSCKGAPTFCIVKNIASSKKGNVHLLTIDFSILVPMLLPSFYEKIKKVFNIHISNMMDMSFISFRVKYFICIHFYHTIMFNLCLKILDSITILMFLHVLGLGWWLHENEKPFYFALTCKFVQIANLVIFTNILLRGFILIIHVYLQSVFQ